MNELTISQTVLEDKPMMKHLPPYFKRLYLLTDLLQDVSQLPHFLTKKGLRWGIVNSFHNRIFGQILRLKKPSNSAEITNEGESFEIADLEWNIVQLLQENSTYLKLVVTGSQQHLTELSDFLRKYENGDTKLWSVHEIHSVEIRDLPWERNFESITGMHVETNSDGISMPSAQRSSSRRSSSLSEIRSRRMEKAEVFI